MKKKKSLATGRLRGKAIALVFAMDRELSVVGESNGRTGKSILGSAIGNHLSKCINQPPQA